MREKGGRTKAGVIDDASAASIHRAVHSNIETGSTLHTDEHGGYVGLEGLFYGHERINHSAGEYVRDGVTTNSIESVWAVMKRGLHGVYHHASPKHLDRYVIAKLPDDLRTIPIDESGRKILVIPCGDQRKVIINAGRI